MDLLHLHGAQRSKSGSVHPDRRLIRAFGLCGTAPFQFAASSGSSSAGFFRGIRIRQRPAVSIIEDPEFPGTGACSFPGLPGGPSGIATGVTETGSGRSYTASAMKTGIFRLVFA